MDDPIRIRGARQHNLKGIDVDLPRRQLIVITGPSGSGKSSLALDTLFAEGQRRYVESLSTYAKQFLERMEKPLVDSIEGIAPAVAIEQKNPTKTSRSTVGTATEVHDYLRLLFARVGRTHCPECDRQVRPDTVSGIVDRVQALPAGTRFMVTFPLRRSERIQHASVVENLKAMGFVRCLAGGRVLDLGEEGAADPATLGVDLVDCQEVLIIVDRLTADPDARERLADSVQTAFSEGECVVVLAGAEADGRRLAFTEHFRCPDHPAISYPDLTPQLFSFNSPYGSCPGCTGFGATLEYDVELIVPNPKRSIDEGAVDPWTKPRYTKERDRLRAFAREQKVSLYTPWDDLDESFRSAILNGEGGRKGFKGVIPFLRSKEAKRYKQYIRVFLRQYQSPIVCAGCGGTRIRHEALRVRVGESTIGRVSELPLEEMQGWLASLTLTEMEGRIAESILVELRSRVDFLVEVGLGYLTLARQTRTLSGGESQRITLANSLGSRLVDTLYVLDEPTVGLHPRDTSAMLSLLCRLRDAGNTVVVVEHDQQAMRAADQVIELGPAAGEKGGEIVFQGTPAELERADTSTGRYLSGRSDIALPDRRRKLEGPGLSLRGARLHNVRGADIEIPLGVLTAVTGVSGSGKSTLVHDILYRALEHAFRGGETSAKEHLGEEVGAYDALEGVSRIEDVVLVDQSPIGRTPRSNPVTYIKAWDEVRRIFANQPLARQREYGPGTFSFNTPGGRCEGCSGAGHVEIEMVFMADVFVPCEACGGKRFKPEVLDVKYRDLSIAQVLELTVDEAIRFFIREDRLGKILWHLQQVGLGYLRLGQPATTLSGGEAQRLKIARELAGAAGKKGRKLYLLDEPTTGLSGEDVRKLLRVLDRLLDVGHTVLVIEHNLDVIRSADWVIDMGPGAGHRGGEVVAMGRPEDVARVPESVTGRYLREAIDEGRTA
ncbi:MAG: excinuclease ABC subunit A [Gemmatimonadetes bacterium]|nr:excinuclease ABC subunit A [Gemmatimonadota bacterium]